MGTNGLLFSTPYDIWKIKMSIINRMSCSFAKVSAFNLFQEKKILEKFDHKNDPMYNSRILKNQYERYFAFFWRCWWDSFKINFPKIVDHIKTFGKRKRSILKKKYYLFSLLIDGSKYWWKIKLNIRSQCLKYEEFRTFSSKFLIKKASFKDKARKMVITKT